MISAGNWECNSCVEIAPEVAEETQVALWPVPAENAKAHDSVVSSSDGDLHWEAILMRRKSLTQWILLQTIFAVRISAKY